MTRGVSAQVALVALAICAGVFAGAGPAAAEEGEVKPIDLVVAVDESGSLSPDDVAQEKAAAATIALGELSAQSRVIVFGFASKGAKPAVESPPCVLEPGAGAAGREAMSQCIQQNINRRNSGEGDDTDFVSALNQGISDLGTGDRPKVLFLLTDGRLDVRGDTSYGPDENAQQQHAEDLLKRQVLPKAKERGIQVWPLGFGGDIDQGMLEYFAANGGRAQCDGREVTPKATVVRDTGGARLLQSMQEAFASARCGGSSFAPPVSIDGGGEVTLKVAIPAVATDGTITVYKADPNVTVTFTDPDGHKAPSSGEVDGSKFELAGNSGTVEALRIRNPKPGDWTVKVVAPAGLSKQLVTASALWQGVLRSVFFLDPPSPAPGQTFTVVMRPHTRSIEITDPKVLAGLSFSARLTGAGADTSVALLDDGKGPDAKANDALYSASFQLPANASGSYTVRGVATGTGVAADEHSLTFEPGRPQVISAQIEFDRGPVDAGTTRSGVVRVKNDDTAPHEVRLLVKGPSASDSVSVSPATAMAAPGDSTFTFSLAFASDARGPSGGSLQLIDAASGDVVTNTPLGVTIEEPRALSRRTSGGWWSPRSCLPALSSPGSRCSSRGCARRTSGACSSRCTATARRSGRCWRPRPSTARTGSTSTSRSAWTAATRRPCRPPTRARAATSRAARAGTGWYWSIPGAVSRSRSSPMASRSSCPTCPTTPSGCRTTGGFRNKGTTTRSTRFPSLPAVPTSISRGPHAYLSPGHVRRPRWHWLPGRRRAGASAP